MKFLRAKAVVITIVVMTLLCAASVAISVQISVNLAGKENKETETVPAADNEIHRDSRRPVNADRLKALAFYFNGRKVEGVDAWLHNGEEVMLPVDAVFKKLGIGFRQYSPDDMIEAQVEGKQLVFHLKEGRALLGSSELMLPVAPAVAKNHILAPSELFTYLDAPSIDGYKEKGTVFINYYPGFEKENWPDIRLLKHVEDTVRITDLKGEKDYGHGTIDPLASLSADGRYLYWTDREKKTAWIYDIGSGKTGKLGDYHTRIKPGSGENPILPGEEVLFDYKAGSGYKRIVFTDASRQSCYAFIERKGKLVIEGNVSFSPDRKKILYYKKGKGYYMANSDGTGVTLLGEGTHAEWVNNRKIFLKTSEGDFVCRYGSREKNAAEEDWRKIGQAADGAVFFKRGGDLYCEVKGKEKMLFRLPWECDHILAVSADGPYIAVSVKEDGIFYIKGSTVTSLGKFSSLNTMGEGFNENQCIAISPDNTRFAVLQPENGFIMLNMVENNKEKIEKLLINCPYGKEQKAQKLRSRWISNDRLLVCTAQRGWILQFGKDIAIYDWTEEKGSTIAEVLP